MLPTEVQEMMAKVVFIIFATIMMLFPKVHSADISIKELSSQNISSSQINNQ